MELSNLRDITTVGLSFGMERVPNDQTCGSDSLARALRPEAPTSHVRRVLRTLGLLATAFLLTTTAHRSVAFAQTQSGPHFVVNTVADTDDGACDLLGQGTGNQDCTLREAMLAASAHPGHDTITFDIPDGVGCTGANVCTIQLGATLPAINGSGANGDRDLTIDGASNGGKITIDGGDGQSGGVQILNVFASTLHLHALNLVDANGGALITAFVELTVTNCTFANNYRNGGGAALRSENRPVTIVNSTFYNNTGTSSGAISHGGASFAPMNIINSTIAGNQSIFDPAFGAASIHVNGQSVTLQNTLVAKAPGNFNPNCMVQSGSLIANSINVVNDFSCGGATPTNIYLHPLADNGGPTLTMAPIVDSDHPIDTGDAAVCSAWPVNNLDQRGYVRPAGAGCDIGAFEVGSVPAPPTPTATPTATPSFAATATATATPTPILAGSCATEIADVRASIDAACSCDGLASRRAYLQCARLVLADALAASTVSKACRSGARAYYTASTCGRNSQWTWAPCVRTSMNGKITCAIKREDRCNKAGMVACPSDTHCLDAADTNNDGKVGAGDSGSCTVP